MLIIKSYFNFLANPKKNYSTIKSDNELKVFILVLLITYTLIFFVSFIPSTQTPITKEAAKAIPANLLILLTIPLYEELIFRLPLKVSAVRASISFSLFISSILLILTNLILKIPITLLEFHLLSFILAIPFFFLFKYLYNQATEAFLIKNYNYLFFANLILFSVSHFYYQDISLSALLTYLIYGYSLSFLRISTKFFYGLILHMIFIAPLIYSFLTSFRS
ncbi:hypothetical protein C900_00237 [Fulvivirga imtechensis AK7]|uniref:Uncharacterized protein n=1 Tax=Fulvivirga imtechensis AK7 TaxID=1237149 RepID=L8JM36_9BACT|nr:hypothetical protein C900_00237 [Fulvivirga imtechensis AK7]